MRKNIKANLVNLTLKMRYKNDKKTSNLSSPHSFFQAQNMHQNPFSARWGSLRRSPRPPSRLGMGIPPPHSPPRSTPSASRTVGASVLRPPQHKSWLRQSNKTRQYTWVVDRWAHMENLQHSKAFHHPLTVYISQDSLWLHGLCTLE